MEAEREESPQLVIYRERWDCGIGFGRDGAEWRSGDLRFASVPCFPGQLCQVPRECLWELAAETKGWGAEGTCRSALYWRWRQRAQWFLCYRSGGRGLDERRKSESLKTAYLLPRPMAVSLLPLSLPVFLPFFSVSSLSPSFLSSFLSYLFISIENRGEKWRKTFPGSIASLLQIATLNYSLACLVSSRFFSPKKLNDTLW